MPVRVLPRRVCPVSAGIIVWFLACTAPLSAGPLPPSAPPPNIMILSMDATRADHLSLYGYPLPTSKNLDRFSEHALVFENAHTVVPLTGPSHTSLFTSLVPHRHGAFRNGIPLKASFTTLAEHLKQNGYDTAAFVSGWTLRGNLCGLDQGFDHYDDHIPHRYKLVNRERYAEETNGSVRAFLDARGNNRTPLFLFVHYFDAHDPYRRHAETYPALQRAAASRPATFPPTKDVQKALDYDSEVAYVDLHLGRLLDLLQEKGLLQNALVVILADHGESLGEHGYWGHGRKVYEPTLRIPLILYAPQLFPVSRRLRDPVNTLDLLPTILSLANLPPPPGVTMEGRDLAGLLLKGEPLPPQRAYFETFPGSIKRFTKLLFHHVPKQPMLMGYLEDGNKVIFAPGSNTLEIYNLTRDPAETVNLAGPVPPSRQVFDLTSWYHSGRYRNPVRARLSPEEAEQLKSLGYIN
jgi:arylsulfatase A-like enzyme